MDSRIRKNWWINSLSPADFNKVAISLGSKSDINVGDIGGRNNKACKRDGVRGVAASSVAEVVP